MSKLKMKPIHTTPTKPRPQVTRVTHIKVAAPSRNTALRRSEEHTSELQSH